MIEEEIDCTVSASNVPQPYDWQGQASEEPDRSDWLSVSENRIPDAVMSSGHRRTQWNETQFNDRDDLRTASAIMEEDFFSQEVLSKAERRSQARGETAMNHLQSEPPKIQRRNIKRDIERYVQSTHNVSKFNELNENLHRDQYDGTCDY